MNIKELFSYVTQDIRAGLVIIFLCSSFVVVASIIDMWTKIEAVKAIGGKMESRPLSKTGDKIKDYLRLIVFFLMIDILGLVSFSWYAIPYAVLIITAGILLREGLSVKENYELKKSNAVKAIEYALRIIDCNDEQNAKALIKQIIKESRKSKHTVKNETETDSDFG